MKYRWKLMLLLVSIALLTGGVTLIVSYTLSRSILVGEIRSKVQSIAATAAAQVDGDLHATIRGPGDQDSPAYRELEAKLRALRDANRRDDVYIRFVYTMVPSASEPGALEFRVDAEEAGSEFKSGVGEVYEAPAGRANPPIDRPSVEMFVRDEYGVWVTGNAPVRDAQGRAVALLGVDMDAAQLLARTRNLLLTGVLAAGAGVAAAALLALITSRSLTRRLEQVTGVVERIGAGDLNARVPEDVAHASGDEISTVAHAVNRVAPQLSAFLKLRQSLALAMEVQQALLPAGAPSVRGLDIAGKSIYCDETGGDYYDFLDVAPVHAGGGSAGGAPKELGIAVGDVTGHGVPAALLMTTARALIRGRVARTGSLAQVFDDINRLLAADTGGTRFMTLFYMVLDPETRAVRWISAGHDPAIIYNAEAAKRAGAPGGVGSGGAASAGPSGGGGAGAGDAGFSELEGDDIPLGIDETWSFTEKRGRTLSPGDVVVIGTDGIWESRNAAGKDFGKDRLRGLVREHAQEPAAVIAEAIARELREFRGEGRAQEDDVTLVVLKVA